MDPFTFPLPSVADKSVARQNASEIAQQLQSKVVSHRRIIVGEPHCPYRVPCHKGDFWFKVLVSDHGYVFTGEHRRCRAYHARFALAFGHPDINLGATEDIPTLSTLLGLNVFQNRLPDQNNSVDIFLTAPIRDLIQQIDFSGVRICFLNSTQIYVTSEFRDSEHCVQQIRVFRELLLSVFHATHLLTREAESGPGE